jgi:hypothetical protein
MVYRFPFLVVDSSEGFVVFLLYLDYNPPGTDLGEWYGREASFVFLP